ncbi:hypothetical protein QQP08_011372 [Theobroma cacao]|nr:hypothetical protein QQP08_011372 [Theobroma cacao]
MQQVPGMTSESLGTRKTHLGDIAYTTNREGSKSNTAVKADGDIDDTQKVVNNRQTSVLEKR